MREVVPSGSGKRIVELLVQKLKLGMVAGTPRTLNQFVIDWADRGIVGLNLGQRFLQTNAHLRYLPILQNGH